MHHTTGLAARFSASALTYDRSAVVQKAVARRVAELVAELPAPRRTLEIGCGTGFLTEKLLEVLPEVRIHALDISEGMIRKAQLRLGPVERVTWIVADARRFEGDGAYELVASSSCLHWIFPIEDAFRALGPRLAPGGYLVFGLMLDGTLAELQASRRRVAAGKPGRAALPATEDVLTALGRTGFRLLRSEQNAWQVEYPSVQNFLRAVHDQGVTGGNVSRENSSVLNRGELKRLAVDYVACNRSAGGGVMATYHVLYAVAQKGAS